MWGCHFLILSSNVLWRKFVKLDQGCLKLVYKGVREGRRRRNVVHLRRLRCLQSARLGGTAFSPSFLLHSYIDVRCHVFWHFTLEEMQEEVARGGWVWEGMCREDGNTCIFCYHIWFRVKALFLLQRNVFTNHQLTGLNQMRLCASRLFWIGCTLSCCIFHPQ